MSEGGKAVFLSYASQDAGAAQRICDALRAAGVEVWFDQNELVGGDAWDAKIRKQIGECALFVPIISANTQARREGYFRIEWRLAAQRTHAMSDDTAFLLPVVIDATGDADARVPVEFKAVQWTRLTGAGDSEKFCTRVQRLLAGESESRAWPRGPGDAPPSRANATTPASARVPVALGALALAVIVGLLVFAFRPRSSSEANPPAAAAARNDPAGHAAPAGTEISRVQARIVPDRWQKGDFEAVSATLDRITQSDPENAEAWALRSIINSLQVLRIIDPGTKPLEAGKAAAEHALRLAPAASLPNLALGLHLVAMISRGGDPTAGREIIARATANLPPDDFTRYARIVSCWLGYDFEGTQRHAAQWLEVDPAASYPAWILTSMSVTRRQPAEIEKWAKISIADPDVTGVRTLSSLTDLHYYLRANLAEARATIDRVPLPQRAVARVVIWRWLLAMAEEKWDVALQELARVPDAFLFEISFNGPKALLAGLAHQQAGRGDAAAAQFRDAERLLREKLAADADNEALRTVLAVTLASAGRSDDARRELALVEPLVRTRAPTVYRGRLVVAIAQCYAAMKDYAAMALWLRRIFAEPSGLPFTPASVRLDPRFKAAANAPEIAAVLKEFASLDPAAAPAGAESKSIAVLAFDNRSDDKDAENFSDGISDELIRVLGRVPGLTVKGSTSAFFFKGRNATAREIGEKLGAAYLVRGSVQKSGGTVRITAQLTRAETDEVVWVSEPLRRELKDLWAVQEEIAGLIAKNLQLKLELSKARVAVQPEAYALLLNGRAEFRRESIEGWNRAIGYFRQAIALEPNYAVAWGEIALSYTRLARFGGLPTIEGMREARSAAQKALELDPEEPVGWHALAWVQRTADWNWREAQRSFQRALELAPGDAGILSAAAVLQFNIGRVQDAIALARQAVERDPLRASTHFTLGSLLIGIDPPDEGCAVLQRAIELAPAAEQFRHNRALGLAHAGRHAEAAALIEEEPNLGYRLAGRALVLGIKNELSAAKTARDEFVAKFGERMPAICAATFAAVGDRDQGFAWLQRSLAQRDSDLAWAKTARHTAPLRADPRWNEFLRKIGLADEQLR